MDAVAGRDARRPRVAILTLGGTIAMADESDHGVVPSLRADDVVRAVPGLESVAVVDSLDVLNVPSAHLSIPDVLDLARTLITDIEPECDGVVITQGTDTIEETTFLLDLLVPRERPVVVTGAMRGPTEVGSDGAANLLAAVQVAAQGTTADAGVVVVMNQQIHAARYVRKVRSSGLAAFESPLLGPVGWVSEGRPHVGLLPPPSPTLPIPPAAPPPVALHAATLDDDGRLIASVLGLGFAGLVVEAFGGGHLPAAYAERLKSVGMQVPVVLASRTGAGEMLRETYGFPGSEGDLLASGMLSAGWLDGRKARLLLSVLLATHTSRSEAEAAFVRWIVNSAATGEGGDQGEDDG